MNTEIPLMARVDVGTGELCEISILDIGGGVVREFVERELKKISQNLLDENTSFKKKRIISLQLEFSLVSEQRDAITVDIKTESKLAPLKPCTIFLSIGSTRNNEVVIRETGKQIEGQINFEGQESPINNNIRIAK